MQIFCVDESVIGLCHLKFQFDTFIDNFSLYYYTLQNANMLLLRHLHIIGWLAEDKQGKKSAEEYSWYWLKMDSTVVA